jgi:hypothetical protein
MDPMIEMTSTPPRCGPHLLLKHMLIASTLYHLWKKKNTHLEETKFDNIASQNT